MGAFNINNLEASLAVSEATVEEKSPAIVAVTPSAVKYASLPYVSKIVKTASVPAWLIEKANKYGAELGGAKGIPEGHIKKAISLGIARINIDTGMRLAFKATVREVLADSPKEFDPRKILGSAKEAVKEVVRGKMRLFGSSGRA